MAVHYHRRCAWCHPGYGNTWVSSRYLRVPLTCSGYFTFWFNIATAGRTDKFWPRTNALTSDASPAMQQSTRLFHIKHQLRLCRDLHAEIRFRFHFRWRIVLNGRPRRPVCQPSVQQAHIFSRRHKALILRHTRCSVYVTPGYRMRLVVSAANAVFASIASQLRSSETLFHSGSCFPLVGVDVVSAGNMAG